MIINSRIEADTLPVAASEHTLVRLMNDDRWPWFVLLPAKSRVSELHQLSQIERDSFLTDVNILSECIQTCTACRSVNIAMLGNVVADLHCHVIARDPGDPNWPNPVWGFEQAVAYTSRSMPEKLLACVTQHFST